MTNSDRYNDEVIGIELGTITFAYRYAILIKTGAPSTISNYIKYRWYAMSKKYQLILIKKISEELEFAKKSSIKIDELTWTDLITWMKDNLRKVNNEKIND